MARSQFTFTFPNAQPGAPVTFSAAVYSSKVDATADGPTLSLDSQRTVAVWTDATELTATWKDGSGASIAAEASLDRPVVTAIGGVPGQPTAASGASVPAARTVALNIDPSTFDYLSVQVYDNTATALLDVAGADTVSGVDVASVGVNWLQIPNAHSYDVFAKIDTVISGLILASPSATDDGWVTVFFTPAGPFSGGTAMLTKATVAPFGETMAAKFTLEGFPTSLATGGWNGEPGLSSLNIDFHLITGLTIYLSGPGPT